MAQRGLGRWAPLAGVVFVALTIIGFAVAGSSPDPDDSNAKIAAYLANNSKYDKNIVAFFLVLAAMLFLLGFFGALRSRLVDAEDGHRRLAALAFGAGVASAVFFFIGISVFIAPSFAAHDARHGKAVLDPGIYRITQDLGYEIWVASAVVGALAVWATSAIILQTNFLPRWFGWLGILIGVVCLFAILFVPIFVYWLWIVLAAILLVARPGPGPPSRQTPKSPSG